MPNKAQQDKNLDEAETCHNCGNTYIVDWLKEGPDFNDFGMRHCPFCGLLTDELAGRVVS